MKHGIFATEEAKPILQYKYHRRKDTNKILLYLSLLLLVFSPTSVSAQRETGQTPEVTSLSEIESLADEKIEEIREAVAKGKSEIAEEKLKIVNTILSSLGWALALITFVALISAWAVKVLVRHKTDDIESALKKTTQKLVEEELGKVAAAQNNFYATTYVAQGHTNWLAGNLTDAILRTETALAYNPPDEQLQARGKSNLAYFYAQARRWDKKSLGIEYAKFAKDLYSKYPARIAWISNDVYVSIMFAETVQELDKAKQLAEQVKTDFGALAEEMDEYLGDQVPERRREILRESET